jgi:hypothetical protein
VLVFLTKRRIQFAVVAAIVLQSVTTASGTPAITFTGGQTTTSFTNRTFGYNFSTGANPLTITSLGFWDELGNGLAEAHQVGIWNATGTSLLASAIIPAGTAAALDSQFRFVPITPVNLPANLQFLAGAFTGSIDPIIRYTTATTIPAITLGSTRFDPEPYGTFQPPTLEQGTTFDKGYFGPNFNGAVPEPNSIVLLVIGSAMLPRRREK